MMSIEITITTGGLTKVGVRKTYHIYKESDFKRVAKRIKEIVKKYPSNTDLYGIGQRVEGIAVGDEIVGHSESPLETEEDVDKWIEDLKIYYNEYWKNHRKSFK